MTLRNALCKSFIIILWWEIFFETILLDTYPVNLIKYDVRSHFHPPFLIITITFTSSHICCANLLKCHKHHVDTQ